MVIARVTGLMTFLIHRLKANRCGVSETSKEIYSHGWEEIIVLAHQTL